jgi:DNA-binding transcriptional LysR family regulator
MDIDLSELNAFLSVAKAGGFRDAARISSVSAPQG